MRQMIVLTLSLATLALGCASNAQLEAGSAPAEVGSSAAAAADARPVARTDKPSPGVCRAYALPADFDAKGVALRGAFSGEIHGEQIGDELEYMAALRACVDNPECLGVTSSWYVGTPFKLIKVGGELAPDDNSYGCATAVSARP